MSQPTARIRDMTHQTETTRKPVYKTVWFWLLTAFALAGAFIMFVLVVGMLLSAPTADSEPAPAETETVATEPADESERDAPAATVEEKAEESPIEEDVPREYRAALKSAESYIRALPYSADGLFRQLTSEWEGFPDDAAQYAIDNIDADWNEQALRAARSYVETMGMSDDGLRRQLTSEWEGYTDEQVEYAIANLEP